VVVLDNASAHVSTAFTAAQPALEAAGVTLYYLPPYSPELNRIEDLWRHVKYEELPVRSYRTLDDLRTAVEGARTDHAATLRDDTTNFRVAA
jgi:transposase